jgi:phage FluMu protein Com
MYEVRCPKCNKKLAETTRKITSQTDSSKKGVMIAESKSPYLVSIKCKRCKTITRF